MLFRSLNVLDQSGLRMINYITLGIICCYQVNWWAKKGGSQSPFLQSFGMAFFTGTLSFLFFAVFIYIYSMTDPYFAEFYFSGDSGTMNMIPFILIFFKGSSSSIIIGLITMMYSEKFKDEG